MASRLYRLLGEQLGIKAVQMLIVPTDGDLQYLVELGHRVFDHVVNLEGVSGGHRDTNDRKSPKVMVRP